MKRETDLAEKLFGNKRLEKGADKLKTTTIVGKALSDSENGYVAVEYEGNITFGDEQTNLVPTGPYVKAGDTVLITAVGGTGKSISVTNVQGWGDRVMTEPIDGARITNASISGASINFSTFSNGVITGSMIQDSTIEGSKIKESTITNSLFADGTIEGSKIKFSTFEEGVISGSVIQNSTLEGSKFKDGTIEGSKIKDSTLTNSLFVDGTIEGSKIKDSTITGGKVIGSTLTDIPYAGIKDADINVARVANAQIASATIQLAQIDRLNSEYAHITEGVIDNAKIDFADINDVLIGTAQIDDAAITTAKIENAAITNSLIKNGAVTDEKVLNLSANKLTAGTIDAAKINVTNLHARNLIVDKLNGQPVIGGYTYISPGSSGYSSKNPSQEGWYEFTANGFVRSEDTEVDESKAYYMDGESALLYDRAYIDSLEEGLNQRIDGAVETWTGDHVPTLENYPAADWLTDDAKSAHVGDIYFVTISDPTDPDASKDGYNYRFAYDNTQHEYIWVLIKDSDVTKALGEITSLQEFESTTTSWIEETDEGLTTIRQNHTALSGIVDKTVKSSTQLWFTKANTTPPGKPSSRVTSTDTTGNGWRTVVPAWNASYPNYFYCWQFELADGTYAWSDVVLDIAMGESQGTSRSAQNIANSNIKSSTMLWFSKADATAPAKPTAQVTSTSTDGNAWRLVVPTYNASYPYYFYCYQQQKGDGTYQWSDVVYDRATTESQSTARAASSSLANYITSNDAALASLKGQVDGAVDIWYGSADPTSSTKPWDSGDADSIHEGDLYYNTTNGHSFRYVKNGSAYSWSQLPDSDAAAALAAAQDAQATADGKRRVFTTQPTPPYDIGDLWVKGTEVRYANKKRESGSYTASEWSLTSTDDTMAKANIKSSVQLWFTKANSTAPAKPTAQVTTNNPATGNAWNLAVPTYSSSYPHYFYCYQQQKGDGTYQWSDVVYDKGTTEAMQKAQAALPSSTYNTFVQSTFKNLVDQVGEQSSTITTMSEAISSSTNLVNGTSSEWTELALTNGTNQTISLFTGLDVTEIPNIKAGDKISVSFDVKYATGTTRTQDSGYPTFQGSCNAGGTWTSIGPNSVLHSELLAAISGADEVYRYSTYFTITESMLNGTYSGICNANLRHDYTNGTVYVRKVMVNRGSMALAWTSSGEDTTTLSNTVNSVRQVSDANSQHLSNLTQTLGTNADGTTKTNDIVHKYNNLDQTLDGTLSTVGAMIDESTVGPNILTGNALNPFNWTVSAPSGANYTKTAYGTAGAKVEFTGVSGWEWLYSPSITVKNGHKYTLSVEYTVGVDYNIASGKGGFGLSAYSSAPPFSSYDPSISAFLGRAQFFEAKTSKVMKATITFTATSTTVYLGLNGGQIADSSTRLSFAMDSLKLVENVESRMSSAETSISQTANAIGLTATGTATISNPNLTPWFSISVEDTSYWASLHVRNGSVSNSEGLHAIYDAPNYKDGIGWAHVTLDSRSSAGNTGTNCYMNMFLAKDSLGKFVTPGGKYTWLIEVSDLNFVGANSSSALHILPSLNNNTMDVFSLCDKAFTASGSATGVVTAKSSFTSLTQDTRGYCYIQTGCYADFYLRISLYEGEYTGLYKPYVGPKLYASQAELKVANDNISLKVNTNGVIGAINLSSETAKIKASKVEIDGTAVFNSISSKVDGAITAKGYATTSQAQGYANTAETNAKSYADSTVSNLTVGSRNLIVGSMDISTSAGEFGWVSNGGLAEGPKKVYVQGVGDCIYFKKNTTSSKYIPSIVTSHGVPVEWGKEYIYGIDIMIDKPITVTTNTPNHYHAGSNSNGNYFNTGISRAADIASNSNNVAHATKVPANTWVHYEHKFKWKDAPSNSSYPYAMFRPFVYGPILDTEAGSVQGWMRNPYLIEANSFGKTTWSAAPEELPKRNLTPFFSYEPYNAVAGRGGDYWQAISESKCTAKGDGWCRYVTADNTSGTAVTYEQHRPKAIAALSPDTTYTLLIEFRNVTKTGNVYLRCPDGGQGLNASGTIFVDGAAATIDTAIVAGTYHKVFRTGPSTQTNYDVFFGCCTRIDAGAKAIYEMRLSLYEGVYLGPYQPYHGLTIVQEQRIYYRSNSTTAPAAPTTFVTSTAEANATWTTKRIKYDSTYKYIYTTMQRKRLDGTISCDQVLLDDTTTVIDGGNIITGSIAANRLSVYDAAINKIKAEAIDLTGVQPAGSYATTTQLSTETNQRKAQYGTCSTAAATAEKAVTCADFELVAGNELTVKFSTANTSSAAVTLNVNSKGARNVWVGNAVTSATNQLLWGVNAYITFRYDGAQFQVIGEPRTWYGACSTAEGTAAKTDTTAVTGCVVCKGAKVELAMTNANTAASPTLNVQSTGAKAIYFGNGTSRPTKSGGTSWLAANTCTFTFDGAAWRTQGKTYIDANSIVTGYLSADRIEGGSLAIGKLNSEAQAQLSGSGFTILWDANQGTSYAGGEARICLRDPMTGTVTPNTAGWVMFNGVKRTVPYSEFNPNAALPYNIPIYMVLRLSSETSTTGTTYAVFYSSGWKVASAMSSPTTTYTDWTWTEATDLILGKCVEPSSEAVFTECEIYDPPLTAKAVSSATVTAASANSAAAAADTKATNAAKTATNYITADSSGIKIHNASDTTNYVHQSSNGTKVYKGGYLKANYADTITLYGGSNTNGTYPKTEISSTAVKMYQSANNHADVTSAGMSIYQGGSEVASFGGSTVELGKNSINSAIKMCNGTSNIRAYNYTWSGINSTRTVLSGTGATAIRWLGTTTTSGQEKVPEAFVETKYVTKNNVYAGHAMLSAGDAFGGSAAVVATGPLYLGTNYEVAQRAKLVLSSYGGSLNPSTYGDIYTNGAIDLTFGTHMPIRVEGDIGIAPVSLYANESAAFAGAITLSETAYDFTRLELYCKDNDGRYCYTQVWNPNGKTVNVTQSLSYGGNFYVKSRAFVINGTKIDTASTSGTYHTGEVNAAGSNNGTAADKIKIVKVIGYR